MAHLRGATKPHLAEFALQSTGQPLVTSFRVAMNAWSSPSSRRRGRSCARAPWLRCCPEARKPHRDAPRLGRMRGTELSETEDRNARRRLESGGRGARRVHRVPAMKPDLTVNRSAVGGRGQIVPGRRHHGPCATRRHVPPRVARLERSGVPPPSTRIPTS